MEFIGDILNIVYFVHLALLLAIFICQIMSLYYFVQCSKYRKKLEFRDEFSGSRN